MQIARRICAVLAMMALIMLPSDAFAVSAPSAIDFLVMQGEETIMAVPVRNDANTQKELAFAIHDVAFGDDGTLALGAVVSATTWVGFDPTLEQFAAGETREIMVSVAPPDDVASGSYVFALVSTEEQSEAFVLAHGTATLLFITVGNVPPVVTCVDFARQQDGSFVLTLRNDGQGILYEEGEIFLRGPMGIRWAMTSSNPSYHRIAAGKTRTWVTEPLSVPWWVVGPSEYSLESDHFSCPRIPAGFGWLPIVLIGAIGVTGASVTRYRK